MEIYSRADDADCQLLHNSDAVGLIAANAFTLEFAAFNGCTSRAIGLHWLPCVLAEPAARPVGGRFPAAVSPVPEYRCVDMCHLPRVRRARGQNRAQHRKQFKVGTLVRSGNL